MIVPYLIISIALNLYLYWYISCTVTKYGMEWSVLLRVETMIRIYMCKKVPGSIDILFLSEWHSLV